MSLTLTVHRGTQEIGGTCIELAHPSGARLILDAGRPLNAAADATGLLPLTLDLKRPATVVISHSHQDHWGLIDELPVEWPVWASVDTASLLVATGELLGRTGRPLLTWPRRGAPPPLGPFRVTPIATDHSAFDAAMLLVEADGQRILYTGDVRRHGRKGALVERLLRHPPKDIDVLVIEGTNLGQDKPTCSEDALEAEFVGLFRQTQGRVFVEWSAQNVDRTVTLYRSAKRTDRTLVVDLYTADVLDRIADGTRLPRPGWPHLRVVVTARLARRFRTIGRSDFVERMARSGCSARGLGPQDVVVVRESLLPDLTHADVRPTSSDAYVHSQWSGYLRERPAVYDWALSGGASVHAIHTSGHASPADLRAIAAAVAPQVVIFVHGEAWDRNGECFGPLRRLTDGEAMIIA